MSREMLAYRRKITINIWVNLAFSGGDAGVTFCLLPVDLADPWGSLQVGSPNNEPFCLNEFSSWPKVSGGGGTDSVTRVFLPPVIFNPLAYFNRGKVGP